MIYDTLNSVSYCHLFRIILAYGNSTAREVRWYISNQTFLVQIGKKIIYYCRETIAILGIKYCLREFEKLSPDWLINP